MLLFDGHDLRSVAMYNAPPVMVELRQREPVVPRNTPVGEVVETGRMVQFPDVTASRTLRRWQL